MSALASITTEQISSDPTLVRCTGKPDVDRQRSIRSGCSSCGKRDGLYWAHIDGTHAGLNESQCERCGKTVSLVFVEGPADSSTIDRVHAHLPRTSGQGNGNGYRPTPRPYAPRPQAATPPCEECGNRYRHEDWCSSTDKPASSPAPSSPAPADDEAAKALLELLRRPSISMADVREMVADAQSEHASAVLDMVESLVIRRLADLSMPVSVHVVTPDRETKPIENCHKVLPAIIKAASLRLFVLMVGPMGTGKSTIAAQVAESLGLDFRFKAVGPQTSESSILGYMTADGTYVPTLFRQAYEHGGVFLFDELDAAHPGVLTIINSALANGHMAFPDGMVTRHPDTIILAAANTYGRGPDRMYVGRQAIDAATLDRFVVVDVEIDERLEQQLASSTGLDAHKVTEVLAYIRALRTNALTHKMAVGFSPRASVNACKLLSAGWEWDAVRDSTIRKGLSDQDWSKVTSGVYNPSYL